MHLSNLDPSARGSPVSEERHIAPQRCDGYHYKGIHPIFGDDEQFLFGEVLKVDK